MHFAYLSVLATLALSPFTSAAVCRVRPSRNSTSSSASTSPTTSLDLSATSSISSAAWSPSGGAGDTNWTSKSASATSSTSPDELLAGQSSSKAASPSATVATSSSSTKKPHTSSSSTSKTSPSASPTSSGSGASYTDKRSLFRGHPSYLPPFCRAPSFLRRLLPVVKLKSANAASRQATYYIPDGGDGACGPSIGNDDAVVALNTGMYRSDLQADGWQSNACGKKVTITAVESGVSFEATIQDECMGCTATSLDLTEGLWNKVNAQSGNKFDGIFSITWEFQDYALP